MAKQKSKADKPSRKLIVVGGRKITLTRIPQHYPDLEKMFDHLQPKAVKIDLALRSISFLLELSAEYGNGAVDAAVAEGAAGLLRQFAYEFRKLAPLEDAVHIREGAPAGSSRW